MLKTSTRVNILSFTACIVFIGSIFYGQKEYFYNCYEFCTVFIANIVNLRIAGWYIPWRYVLACILVASVFVYYKVRVCNIVTFCPAPRSIGSVFIVQF